MRIFLWLLLTNIFVSSTTTQSMGKEPEKRNWFLSKWRHLKVKFKHKTNLKPVDFCIACKEGNLERTILLIESGANINYMDDKGNTLLHKTACKGHSKVANLLIDSGAEINATNNIRVSPLHKAAWKGHAEAVQLLIDRGADVEATDHVGSTSLHTAAWKGHCEIAKLLLDAGAEVNAKDKDDITPLHYAALQGHIEVANLLINRGAMIDAQNENGWTPLHSASFIGYPAVANLLIDSGAVVNDKSKCGDTPLHKAARQNHIEIVNLLINRGAMIDAQNDSGFTSLHSAVWRGHAEVVKLLLSNVQLSRVKGLTPTIKKEDGAHEILDLKNLTFLFILENLESSDELEQSIVLNFLRKYHVDLEYLEDSKADILINFCQQKHFKHLKRFIAMKNLYNKSARDIAQEANENVCFQLLQKESDLNIRHICFQLLQKASDAKCMDDLPSDLKMTIEENIKKKLTA